MNESDALVGPGNSDIDFIGRIIDVRCTASRQPFGDTAVGNDEYAFKTESLDHAEVFGSKIPAKRPVKTEKLGVKRAL